MQWGQDQRGTDETHGPLTHHWGKKGWGGRCFHSNTWRDGTLVYLSYLGEQHAIMRAMAHPPRESISSLVSFESRYGM